MLDPTQENSRLHPEDSEQFTAPTKFSELISELILSVAKQFNVKSAAISFGIPLNLAMFLSKINEITDSPKLDRI